MRNLVLFAMSLLVVLLSGCPNAPTEKTYSAQLPIIDDFNRADSASVGSPWAESETGSAICMISNGKLKIVSAYASYPLVTIRNIKPFNNHKLTMLLSGENTNMDFYLYTINNSRSEGYLLNINSTHGITLDALIGGMPSGSGMLAFTYHQWHEYEIVITAIGSTVILQISNRNNAATNFYSVGGNVGSDYDCISVYTGNGGVSNAVSYNIDEIKIEEQ